MQIQVIINQMILMVIYMALGWIFTKTGLMDRDKAKFISAMVVNLTLPCSLIAATNLETDAASLLRMLYYGVVYAIMIMVSMWLTIRFCRKRNMSDAMVAVNAGLTSYPNGGFMGMPMCVALMGQWGYLYGAAQIVAFNAVFFTWEAALFEPHKKFNPKDFLTIINVATVTAVVLLAFRIKLPSLVVSACTSVGNMTTPLALMAVGIMLGVNDLTDVIRCKAGYVITIIRNVIWPVIMIGILAVLPMDNTLRQATMVFVVSPCANMTVIYATQYDMEADYSTKVVVLSTLLAVITMPAMLMLTQLVFP